MKDILQRLNEINTDLKNLADKEGEVYTILRNRRHAERDGIVFALKRLGLDVINDPYGNGWRVYAIASGNSVAA